MKRVFLILATLLVFGSMKAQQPTHYPFNYHDFPNTMTAIIQIQINGVEQTSNELELGAFNGDMVTGAERIGCYGSHGYYRVYLSVYGSSGSYEVSFKLYNHQTEEELDNYNITYQGEPYTFTWISDTGIGSNKKPIVINFTTSSASSYTKEITGYTGDKDHYYLIASPVGDLDPENVENMLTNSYDLYFFDQTQSLEWINYEAGAYNLVSGMGYLYANSQDVTLTFNGTPIEDNTYEVSLVMDEDAPFAGWNLVGNPFACNATVSVSNFYRMNADGTELEPNDSNDTIINVMEGIFVNATEDGQSVIFSKVDSNTGTVIPGPEPRSGDLSVNVIRKGNRIDLARVRFGKGRDLEKFQLNPNHTKVYFPVEGKDMAVVYLEGQIGELPLNFKAESNGSYTLSFANEDRAFSYLHLIDNMTGNEVNLLQTPNYSFEAKTTDYASRFKLVFATGSSEDMDSFAFVNGMGNLTLFGIEGEATLQIIDVLGHMLSSNTFSGSYERKLDVTPGTYMLRLINGDNIRVQKLIVR